MPVLQQLGFLLAQGSSSLQVEVGLLLAGLLLHLVGICCSLSSLAPAHLPFVPRPVCICLHCAYCVPYATVQRTRLACVRLCDLTGDASTEAQGLPKEEHTLWSQLCFLCSHTGLAEYA